MSIIHNELAALQEAEKRMQIRNNRDEATAKELGDSQAIKHAQTNREQLRVIREAISHIVPQYCPDLSANLTPEEAHEAETA